MTRREELEKSCAALFGGETDTAKRYEILKNAFWMAHNSGYCDYMAGILMSGRETAQTEYWEKACRLKWEVEELCEIYKEELGE